MKQQVLLERECEDQFILSSLPSLRWNVDEGPYTARLLAEGDKELMLCWRLRYRYFVEQRGWVAPDPCHPQLEYDGYDPFAWHLAVFEAEEIVAYLRVLPWRPEVGFMLETEFSSLLSPSTGRALPRIGAVELSRLVCCPQTAAKGEQGSPHALELLLKLLYHLALSTGYRGSFHIVVEIRLAQAFRSSLWFALHSVGRSASTCGRHAQP